MSDGITGNAEYQCKRCQEFYTLSDQDFSFEAGNGGDSDRGMGQEYHYTSEINLPCENCENEISLKFEIWEYPVGIINDTDEEADGADIVSSSFDVFFTPPEDTNEKIIEMSKSLLSLRFERFSENAADLWFTQYKKTSKAIGKALMIFATVLVFSVSVGGIYLDVIQPISSKYERPQQYQEQYVLLRETEKNLSELSLFISNQKAEIDTTKSLLEELRSKKAALQPIVEADQQFIDAIFREQQNKVQASLNRERSYSFLLGVLASIIASLFWKLIDKFRKNK